MINLTDIRRSKRNVFRDSSPFSSLPNLSLLLLVAVQDGHFLLERQTGNKERLLQKKTGTVSFPLLSHELSGTAWRLLYLPHTIRSSVYQKRNGSEWLKLKAAPERKKKPFLGLVSLTSQRDIFSFLETLPVFSGRDAGKPKEKNPWARILGVVFIHSESVKWNLSLSKSDNSYPTVFEKKQ